MCVPQDPLWDRPADTRFDEAQRGNKTDIQAQLLQGNVTYNQTTTERRRLIQVIRSYR
jgi:hypothetical protein